MKARVLSLILVPTLLVLMMFALFVERDMQNLQIGFEDHGYLIANQVAIASEYGAITENMDTLGEAVRSVIAIRDVEGVVILSPEQKAYVEQGYVRLVKEIPSEFHRPYICHREDSFLIFCAPILYTPFQVSDFEEDQSDLDNKIFIGSVQISISTAVLAEKRGESILYAALFIMLTIISTLFMARRIDGQIIKPILELTGVVNGISNGKLDQRALLKSSGEICLLQDGVNLMAKELNSYHTDMQLKVANTTEGLTRALSEIEKKNGELEIAWNRAEDASHAKSLFLAAISHEIRTPLSGMLGMLSLVEHSELMPVQRDQIRNIIQASTALKSLIDDILDFSRIEAGKLNIVNKPFSIKKLVSEVATMLAPSAQIKGFEFVVDIDNALPALVIGDSLRTRQVLINILSNAIKFTENGWVIFRITLAQPLVSRKMVSVCFEISDSGIGIPFERQQSVFECFSQVDQGRERQHEGSGLGATTARQLVELMGGTITLVSEEDVGSQFKINLAWLLEEQTENHVEPALFEGESILVVEDHEKAGAVLKRYLEDFGATVTLVHNLDELEDTLATSQFERIAISDRFDNEQTSSLLRGIGSPLAGTGRVQLGIIRSLADEEILHSSALQYDFRWIKPITPDSIVRSLHLDSYPNSEDKEYAVRSQLALLVAEDDEINAKVITFLLEKRGHRVTRVTNGEEAVKQLHAKRFDAVFMDVRMPGMSGVDATRQWRQHEQDGLSSIDLRIPIVALTANDSERALCMEVGMDGFALKPINGEALDDLEPIIPGL